jgi:hypothetical protein
MIVRLLGFMMNPEIKYTPPSYLFDNDGNDPAEEQESEVQSPESKV